MGPCVRTSACTHLLESSQGLGATTQRNDSFSPGRTREMRSSSRNQVFDLESDFRLEKMCAWTSAFAGTTKRSKKIVVSPNHIVLYQSVEKALAADWRG